MDVTVLHRPCQSSPGFAAYSTSIEAANTTATTRTTTTGIVSLASLRSEICDDKVESLSERSGSEPEWRSEKTISDQPPLWQPHCDQQIRENATDDHIEVNAAEQDSQCQRQRAISQKTPSATSKLAGLL
jgi:hypothetical protein